MLKSYISLLLILLLSAVSGKDQFKVDEQLAIKYSQSYMESMGYIKEVDKIISIKRSELTSIKAIIFKGGGFLLLSTDLRAKPIIGYSPDGNFPYQNWIDSDNCIPLSDNPEEYYLNYLKHYSDQIYHIKRDGISRDINNHWLHFLSNGDILIDREREEVSPMTAQEWGQGYPFNSWCPMLNGTQTVTHCGALAGGLLFQYYKHPVEGNGYKEYQWNGETLFADYGNTIYDWSLIPDDYSNYTPAQGEEVGKVIYHFGVAQETIYGVEYSACNYFDYFIPYAFDNYFNYNHESDWIYRDNIGSDLWNSKIYTELSEGRPVYDISLSAGGHVFLIDGYNDNMYHINWGWYGDYNGYYTFDNLATGLGNFTPSQMSLLGIEPNWNSDITYSLSESEIEVAITPNQQLEYQLSMENIEDIGYYYQLELNFPEGMEGIVAIDGDEDGVILANGEKVILLNIDGSGLDLSQTYSGELIIRSAKNDANIVPITIHCESDIDDNVIETFKLYRNFPNPFNPTTTIEFSLEDRGEVDFEVYNSVGNTIYIGESKVYNSGLNRVVFDGSKLNSGVYYYKLSVGNESKVGKMVMVK